MLADINLKLAEQIEDLKEASKNSHEVSYQTKHILYYDAGKYVDKHNCAECGKGPDQSIIPRACGNYLTLESCYLCYHCKLEKKYKDFVELTAEFVDGRTPRC